MVRVNLRPALVAAVIIVAGVSCSSGDSGVAETGQATAPAATADGNKMAEEDLLATGEPTSIVVSIATTEATSNQVRPVEAPTRQGEEIGFGSIGPPIDVPQPWRVGTIYTDLEPQTLVVDFVPPDQNCIAASARATIGRAGAILVSVSVDSDRVGETCSGGAEVNQIRIPLTEPLGDRRIYTSTVPDTGGASQVAERVADSIIGLMADDAIGMIREEGFEVRDNTGAESVEDDFNPARINIWIADGVVDFAAVY